MQNSRDMVRRTFTVLVSSLFFASAILRVLGPEGAVNAAEPSKVPEVDKVETCVVNPDYIPILNALTERERRAEKKDEELKDKAQDLEVAGQDLRDQLHELKIAEQALRNTIALAQQASDTDVEQLVQVYENMKPKEAAALFAKMDAAFAAGFLGEMAPKAAADILSGLDSSQAYAISVHLAGRNAEVPLD